MAGERRRLFSLFDKKKRKWKVSEANFFENQWKSYFFWKYTSMFTNCKTVSRVCVFGVHSPTLPSISSKFVSPSWIWKKKDSNLVDSASSIRLSQRLSHARLSISDYTVKLRMAHYISYSLFDGPCYLDNRSNSRANTCINPRLLGRGVFIRWKPIRWNPAHGDS